MHEMSIAVNIAEQVRDVIEEHGNVTPLVVKVRVGCLTGIVSEALDFSFSVAAEDILGCRPILSIEEIAVTGRCLDCGHTFSFERFPILCPACEGIRVDYTGGRELELTALEVEDNNENNNCQRKDP